MDYTTATAKIKELAIELIRDENTKRMSKLNTILEAGKTAHVNGTWKNDGGPPANIKDDLRAEDTSQQTRLDNMTKEQQNGDRIIAKGTQPEYREQVRKYATSIEKIVNEAYTQLIANSWCTFYQAYGSSNYPTAISAGVKYKDAIKNHEKQTEDQINSI
jgi:Zn-finger domain-containing protein